MAANYASLTTLATVTLRVDTMPPECSPIAINGVTTGLYVTQIESLLVQWECHDPGPGDIVSMEYAIGAFPEDDSLVGWTATSARANVTVVDPVLVDGISYFVSIRAGA